jgi:chaperonin GroES
MRDVQGNLHPVSLKTGDSVLLPEYGGMKVEIDNEELFLFREDEILGKFD